MAIQVQRRRGTLAENAAFTGALGEFIHITDTNQIAIHDGATAGGTILPNELNLVNDYFGYASSTGTDTIALTVLSAISAYQAGQEFTFKAINTITATATLNVNALGAKTLKKKNPSSGALVALEAGDIFTGGVYTVRYDGTDFQVMGIGGAGGGMELVGSFDVSTSVASIDFDDIFQQGFHYKIVVENFGPVTDGAELYMRYTNDGGATYIAGAANYANNGSTDTAFRIGGTGVGFATGEYVSSVIWLMNPFDVSSEDSAATETGATWTYILENSGGIVVSGAGGGKCRATTSNVEGFQLLFSSGNIENGRMAVFEGAMS